MKYIVAAALMAGISLTGCGNTDPDDGAYGNSEANPPVQSNEGQEMNNGSDVLEDDMNNQSMNDTSPDS